ncbi:MAG TPA: hypothetical protein VLW50_21930 [Streptosporangiaceae bacterium]|nr:hypothetical protein [Streptosporangiaceae bacterium]
MTGQGRAVKRQRLAVLLLTTVILATGCGTAQADHQAGPAATLAPPSLAASLVTSAGTWAVVPMGGNPAFWQLVRYSTAGGRWSLVTPPGVADNGGLVLADLGGQSLVAGFRPSQDLAFSPLAITGDGGKVWSPGILDAGLADVPDALAAQADGRLLAVLRNGVAEQSATGVGASGWSRLTDRGALAASPAGQKCDLRALTAAAFSPSGTPLLAGSCSRPGMAGIFAATATAAGTWRAVGPALPQSLAGRAVTTLRLDTSGGQTLALLAAGTGPSTSVIAGWTSDGGGHWALGPPLALGGAQVRSSGLGAKGAVWLLLSNGRAETISAPGGSWRALPTLPPGTVALALGDAGQFDALATHGSTLTAWRLEARGVTWNIAQTISVPIQYGSSS